MKQCTWKRIHWDLSHIIEDPTDVQWSNAYQAGRIFLIIAEHFKTKEVCIKAAEVAL